MSEVLQPVAPASEAAKPAHGKAVAAIVLGAVSLIPPVYFLVIGLLQQLNPESLIGYLGLLTIPMAPVGVILAGVGIWLAIWAKRQGAKANVGLALCILGAVACLVVLAYFQPWTWWT
ncbi:hypothetical protein [Gulosibacter sp. ACHW.36C]|uniref:Uncharacterized protein n=1 Tax=Gulosibacter sediminis TaxID=1729695 RepID=A0ABY4MXJ5_9MICO|nr:hypothetical protein [Gulosibacter sediminis]UQN15152.1 hypothetical protein M3M28_01400 [Gulosibacter sediminis]